MTEIVNEDFVQLNEDERKRIREAIDEACGLKRIQQDKAEQVKDIVDMVYDNFGVPKKLVRQLIATRFKDNYPETTAEASHFELYYETVFDLDV